MPELHNFDLVGEETKVNMLESWQRWRWVSFVLAPLFLLLRLALVSLCMFVGSFFFADMGERQFKDWWSIAMAAQSIILLYSTILCVINIAAGANETLKVTKYTSLLFLGDDRIEQWIKLPLSAVNVFEIVYWLVLAKFVNMKTKSGFGKSFNFVMASYGTGYLFYIVLLMFLILYLN